MDAGILFESDPKVGNLVEGKWCQANGGSIVCNLDAPSVGSSQWSGTSPGQIYYNGGNVGIGTSSPTQKLDVAGSIKGSTLCIGNDCRSVWPSSGSS